MVLLGVVTVSHAQASAAAVSTATDKATFAGGCFWCVESDFDKIPGVISTTSGYTGGQAANPSYEQVSSHTTGHAEAVQVVYDPSKVSYQRLVAYYWHTIDPTVKGQQFCDHGSTYRTAIFTHNVEQLKIAQASRGGGRIGARRHGQVCAGSPTTRCSAYRRGTRSKCQGWRRHCQARTRVGEPCGQRTTAHRR
ncbi:peptide-methionine (S)-S-oxide reductase MsrA [Rhodoferax sp.]|uniref:peptide-methionine (S)-S-oxide reductase MsrA n=1 Tax=Rhodoferax sp. TaxID=50421 RepID=UPI00351D11B2